MRRKRQVVLQNGSPEPSDRARLRLASPTFIPDKPNEIAALCLRGISQPADTVLGGPMNALVAQGQIGHDGVGTSSLAANDHHQCAQPFASRCGIGLDGDGT